jgi:hypothetical protein
LIALQEPVQEAVDALIASGGETGLQVAVMRNRVVGDFTAVKAIDAIVAAHHG